MICRSSRWPATGSRPSACWRRRTSPMAPGSKTPACAPETVTTQPRPSPSMPQASPLDSSETNYALHVGLEHRFNNVFSVFGRAARAFRTPNVDERVASGPAFDAFFNPLPQNFQLKTQTSHDVEGGFRIKVGRFQMQSSIYNMDLENEIHFIPALFFNINLDPTRRYGSETSASLRVSDTRAAARRHGLYPRGVSRRPVRGQRCSAGVPLHRQWRRDWISGRTISWSTPRCAAGASASWTTIRPTPSA